MVVRRALYVIQLPEFSGAETSQAPVIRADPDALVACPAGSASERFARELGATTVDLPFRSLRHSGGLLETLRSVPRGLATAHELRRILRAQPDRRVVVGTSIRPAMLASLATLGLRRTVVWCAPDRTPPPPLRWLVRLLAWARADVIVCLSEFIRQDLIGRSRRLRRLARVVNPGLELERWKGGAIEPGAPRAAVVGHISHIKRTELAIDTCKRVVEVDDRFVLRVIGSPLFRDEHVELERRIRARLAEDRQLGRSVQLLGHQSDVKAALSGCGLLLHARPDEPFGMVMIEAMALGLPVVAPAAGGALEIVEDGLTGLLYQPEDAAAAATCVLRLIDDPALARTMGAEGRRRVEREFLAARQVDSTARLVAAA